MSDRRNDRDVVGLLEPLRRYALSLTRDPADAEDLVHDALVRAMERRDQFKAGHSLRPWLMSILHNRFVDKARARRTEAVHHADLAIREASGLPGDQEGVVRLADVRRFFTMLPDEQRAALHLVTVEGLSYEEAAGALAIPVGTLVSRLSRARARLRELEEGGPADNVVNFRTKAGPDAL
ncbi:sigma-70 family RNA polymerase sigma factor [Fulvimarina sp. 2208YS6-2-32]|uniref:Sigma-70 family RNA polymerase sigma factor n=1 Tax=Fulvimarina uroteuthidis TaxID=3098149 RepID=A0ABU5I0M4_9HYPH|nr:sigma-70 family RNA polymerase sigma factor [Fulvimarina sp. 2208YS6-2-32]MDY8108761.1 sigma-70 family RNA polymerase sigma factor [Fulvimarina sp. 2208YS6-2-32]